VTSEELVCAEARDINIQLQRITKI